MTTFAYSPSPKKINKADVVTFKCTFCSVEFQRKSSMTKGGITGYSKRFCGPKCHIAYKKENGLEYSRPSKNRNPDFIYKNGRSYKKVLCSDCGIEMERRVDGVKENNYCRPCCNKSQKAAMIGNNYNPKTGGHLNCKQCGKEFYYFAYKLKTRKFCSDKCKYVWERDNQNNVKFFVNKLSGELHPRYKHGKRVGKHVGKQKLRKELIERDGGHWCLFCGKPGPGLHIHRVNYGSQGGKYEIGNCVLLCGEDHSLVHTSKKIWQQPLLEYLSDNTSAGRHWLTEFRTRMLGEAK